MDGKGVRLSSSLHQGAKTCHHRTNLVAAAGSSSPRRLLHRAARLFRHAHLEKHFPNQIVDAMNRKGLLALDAILAFLFLSGTILLYENKDDSSTALLILLILGIVAIARIAVAFHMNRHG